MLFFAFFAFLLSFGKDIVQGETFPNTNDAECTKKLAGIDYFDASFGDFGVELGQGIYKDYPNSRAIFFPQDPQ